MASRKKMRTSALGFRAKTGRAIAVALSEPPGAPELIWRREIGLTDLNVPATKQPYHEVMELPWSEAELAVQPFVRAIEEVASTTLAALIAELQASGFEVRTVGIVGSGDRKLEKIGNEHIRAHAAEGILFRRVLEVAAARNKVRHRTLTEDVLDAIATSELHPPVGTVGDTLKALGRKAGPPWRADERVAATVAWLGLSSSQFSVLGSRSHPP
jgi:hypothetical protein